MVLYKIAYTEEVASPLTVHLSIMYSIQEQRVSDPKLWEGLRATERRSTGYSEWL